MAIKISAQSNATNATFLKNLQDLPLTKYQRAAVRALEIQLCIQGKDNKAIAKEIRHMFSLEQLPTMEYPTIVEAGTLEALTKKMQKCFSEKFNSDHGTRVFNCLHKSTTIC